MVDYVRFVLQGLTYVTWLFMVTDKLVVDPRAGLLVSNSLLFWGVITVSNYHLYCD